MDRIGWFGLDAMDPKVWTYVPGATPGWQGLKTIEEGAEQLSGKGRAMEEREEREREERDEQ